MPHNFVIRLIIKELIPSLHNVKFGENIIITDRSLGVLEHIVKKALPNGSLHNSDTTI